MRVFEQIKINNSLYFLFQFSQRLPLVQGILPELISVEIKSEQELKQEFGDISHIEKQTELGKGSEGTVYLVDSIKDGIKYAVKVQLITTEDKIQKAKREIQFFDRINEHRNIMHTIYAYCFPKENMKD